MLDDTDTTSLHLTLIDRFSVCIDGRELTISSAQARLVLGYLALSPSQSESRAKLAAMIWEESDEERARRNLRQLLYGLRADLASHWDGLQADRSTLSLRSGSFGCDVKDILTQLASGKVPDAVANKPELPNRLLSTVPEQGELFASWLHLKRKEFENELQGGLERILGGDDRDQAERAARGMLGLDASNEKAARALIRLHSARGDTGRALGVYANLWEHLDEVYGMEPAAQTQDLIVEVKSGKLSVPSQTEAAPAPDQQPAPQGIQRERRVAERRRNDRKPTAESREKLEIAVLPVAVSDPTGDAQMIGDLFRTELISRMVSFREIDVIDAAIKSADTEYRLRLTMVPASEQLALIATLTRSADGMVIWSERFGHVVQHWWEYQADVASRLATACSLTLSRARLSEIRSLSTVQGSINNWLMGQKLLDGFRSEDWDAAADCFLKAIDLDPSFSMAYSSLSQVHNIRHLVHPGVIYQRDELLESKRLANAAIALDPTDSRAHLCRAWASLLLGEHAQASASFAISRQCNANDPWTIMSSALGAAFSGELPLANELATRFQNEGWTSNLWLWGYYGNIRFLYGDDQGCVAAIDNAGDSIMNLPAWKAASLWHLGEHAAAAEAWSAFEAAARKRWSLQEEPSSERILAWFLSCFPIRLREARERLIEGATQAAEAYLHCPQT